MGKAIQIAPSILAADFASLGEAVRIVERAGVSMLHVDVMDGHFVPPISIGTPVVVSLRQATRMRLDVHLMVERPERQIEAFAKAGITGGCGNGNFCPSGPVTRQEIGLYWPDQVP